MKLKKVLIINAILLVIILIIAEAVSYKVCYDRFSPVIELSIKAYGDTPEVRKAMKFGYRKTINHKYEDLVKDLPIYEGTAKDKRPVVLLGCSYTEGIGLDRNQTMAAKINKITGRKVYNRGVAGTGVSFVYRQVSDENFKKEIPDAEYFIYTFIFDHVDRQFQYLYSYYLNDLNFTYHLENGKLVLDKHPFWPLYSSFMIKTYFEHQTAVNSEKEYKHGYPMFLQTMKEIKDTINSKYPNSKVVFLVVPESSMCSPDYTEGTRELDNKTLDKVSEIGFTVIDAEKLAGHDYRDIEKYRIADRDHPNERFWDDLVPKLVNYLKM